MKMKLGFLFVFAFLICSVLCSAVSLDLKNVDATTALESLFKGSGKSYTVSAGTMGQISAVSIKDVEFDQALKLICGIINMSYKLDGTTYVIVPKVTVPTTVNTTSVVVTQPTVVTKPIVLEKFTLMYAGPQEILDIIYGRN